MINELYDSLDPSFDVRQILEDGNIHLRTLFSITADPLAEYVSHCSEIQHALYEFGYPEDSFTQDAITYFFREVNPFPLSAHHLVHLSYQRHNVFVSSLKGDNYALAEMENIIKFINSWLGPYVLDPYLNRFPLNGSNMEITPIYTLYPIPTVCLYELTQY